MNNQSCKCDTVIVSLRWVAYFKIAHMLLALVYLLIAIPRGEKLGGFLRKLFGCVFERAREKVALTGVVSK